MIREMDTAVMIRWLNINDCHVPHDLVGKYLTKAENGYLHSKVFFTLDNYS